MATKKEYFEYDGQRLHWRNPRDGNPEASYRATSGLEGHQVPADQCLVNTGPVPAGKYKVAISRNVTYAQLDGDPRVACKLKPGTGLQIIPRGNECETWFANWGHNRVAFVPADNRTMNACANKRVGLYLHDSTKGYSHGCIETENKFFNRLYIYRLVARSTVIPLLVEYRHETTNGGTKE